MVKLAENAGFGLDKIDDNWKAYNDTRPEYIIEFDSVILSFKLETIRQPNEISRDRVGENVGDGAANIVESFKDDKVDKTTKNVTEKSTEKTTEKIIRLVAKNREMAAPEMAKEIGITIRSIERNIEKLKKQGFLKRIGPDKGGYWQVITRK